MSRRGIRSWAAILRREANGARHDEADANGRLQGAYRWERRHGEGPTMIVACCAECPAGREDVTPQPCNARHPDGRLRAEALMLAVASYGCCRSCGSTAVKLTSLNEGWLGPEATQPWERDIRRAISGFRS